MIQTFKRPQDLTHLEVWYPRYHDKYNETKELVATLAQYKVEHATPWIIVEFTKAKHLMGQRFCIKKEDVMKCVLDSNGSIPVYVVRMSQLKPWDTVAEIKEEVEKLWPANIL